MSEPVPDHDARDTPAAQVPPPRVTSKSRWGTPLAIALAVLFVGVLAVLHLTGAVGPGAH